MTMHANRVGEANGRAHLLAGEVIEGERHQDDTVAYG